MHTYIHTYNIHTCIHTYITSIYLEKSRYYYLLVVICKRYSGGCEDVVDGFVVTGVVVVGDAVVEKQNLLNNHATLVGKEVFLIYKVLALLAC